MKTQTFAAAVLVAAAMFGVTACGGDDSPSAGPSMPSQADQQRMEKLTECMRQHGVDVPDAPSTDDKKEGGQEVVPVEGSAAKIEAARAACAKYAPAGEVNEDLTEADQDRALKKAKCLREQGINAKDPEPGTADISVEGTVDNDKLVQAFTVCNKKVGDS
jgi:hypothetical protein